MTRSVVAASTLAALLLVGCGQAARGPVRTPGDATQRAVPAAAARTPDESAGRRPLDESTRVDGAAGDAAADDAAPDQSFASEAVGSSADRPPVAGSEGSAAAARADPFAVLDQAFAAEGGAEDAAEEEDGSVGDAFAALDRAFASEAAGSSADEETVGDGAESAEAPRADQFAVVDRAFAAEAGDEAVEEGAVPVGAGFAAADRAEPRQVGQVFRECDACPEMVVMPGGRLALGRFEVTVGEYGAFASAAGGGGGGCRVLGSTGWAADASASWRNPGFSQTNRHPVVCVSWNDAQQYVSWLSRTTGATYRLPTEGEWGSAAGGSGSGCSVNGGDAQLLPYLRRQSTGVNWQWPEGSGPSCAGSDGALFTASVGSYGSNGVGLSDMVGNVWEWTEGCWNGDCVRRVVRGGSWANAAAVVGPGARLRDRAGGRHDLCGFRVARTLD